MMKKMVLILCLMFSSVCLFAYVYPPSFPELMHQLQVDKQKVEIEFIDGTKLRGVILTSQNDYMVFKSDNEDVMIILYSSIKEVFFL